MALRPAKNAAEALAFIENGGRAVIRTCLRTTVLDLKVLRRFEQAGSYLLKDDGNGIRMRSGQGSVYLLPGQLELVIE